MGRPSKLTPELHERVVKAIRPGSFFAVAARAAGISESSFYRWLERGAAEPDGPYADFRAAVLRAEAESEVHAVVAVRRAALEDWRAARGCPASVCEAGATGGWCVSRGVGLRSGS